MTHAHPEFSLPPELARDALRIVALGGLGEIGRNMTMVLSPEKKAAPKKKSDTKPQEAQATEAPDNTRQEQ